MPRLEPSEAAAASELLRDLVQVELLHPPGRRRVAAREQRQTVDLPGEAAGNLRDRLERASPLLLRGFRPQGVLGLPEEHGRRRLELVGGVRGQPPLRAEGALEPLEERIDDGGEPPELLASRGHRDARATDPSPRLLSASRVTSSTGRMARSRPRAQDRRGAEHPEEHEARERPVDARERAQMSGRSTGRERGSRRGPSPGGE